MNDLWRSSARVSGCTSPAHLAFPDPDGREDLATHGSQRESQGQDIVLNGHAFVVFSYGMEAETDRG